MYLSKYLLLSSAALVASSTVPPQEPQPFQPCGVPTGFEPPRGIKGICLPRPRCKPSFHKAKTLWPGVKSVGPQEDPGDSCQVKVPDNKEGGRAVDFIPTHPGFVCCGPNDYDHKSPVPDPAARGNSVVQRRESLEGTPKSAPPDPLQEPNPGVLERRSSPGAADPGGKAPPTDPKPKPPPDPEGPIIPPLREPQDVAAPQPHEKAPKECAPSAYPDLHKEILGVLTEAGLPVAAAIVAAPRIIAFIASYAVASAVS